MVAPVLPALDLWNLLVNYVFGGFWLTLLSLCLLFGIMLGPVGRMSAYSILWYLTLFVSIMLIGYGYVIFSMLIEAMLIIYLIMSLTKTVEQK